MRDLYRKEQNATEIKISRLHYLGVILVIFLAVAFVGSTLQADTIAPRLAPSYSGPSIVNAADNQPGVLAPNTIATMYGSGLAYVTKALSSSDLHGGLLPTVLPGTGVRIFVGGISAGIFYVSPNQINFLVPSILIPGPSDVQLAIDGLAGPDIPIQLAASAPAFFQSDPQTIIATHVDGSLLTAAAPGRSGESIVLYATGLGQVVPPLSNLQIPTAAARIKQFDDLKITIGGSPLDAGSIAYAGVSPGYPGLYQVNVRLPDSLGQNVDVRIALTDQSSPAGLILPTVP